jgi:hypothetical protein
MNGERRINFVMAKKIIAIWVFLLSFSGTVYSQDISIGLKASTLGLGLEAEKPFTDSLSGRIGVNYFTYGYSGIKDDIEYDFDLNLMSLAVLLDWHPFKGSFRISGGAIYNGNNLEANAKTSATYDIGDTTYTSSQLGTLNGKIDFNNIAPYLGLGWDTSFGKNKSFGFLFELGAIYQGSPKVDLSADGPIANDATFQNELAKEEDNLQNSLDPYKFYPVLAVGLSYRF